MSNELCSKHVGSMGPEHQVPWHWGNGQELNILVLCWDTDSLKLPSKNESNFSLAHWGWSSCRCLSLDFSRLSFIIDMKSLIKKRKRKEKRTVNRKSQEWFYLKFYSMLIGFAKKSTVNFKGSIHCWLIHKYIAWSNSCWWSINYIIRFFSLLLGQLYIFIQLILQLYNAQDI